MIGFVLLFFFLIFIYLFYCIRKYSLGGYVFSMWFETKDYEICFIAFRFGFFKYLIV